MDFYNSLEPFFVITFVIISPSLILELSLTYARAFFPFFLDEGMKS